MISAMELFKKKDEERKAKEQVYKEAKKLPQLFMKDGQEYVVRFLPLQVMLDEETGEVVQASVDWDNGCFL